MATSRIKVKPILLKWAMEVASLEEEEFYRRFDKNLEQWLRGEKSPTLRQLEEFSRLANIPFGFLLLGEPPREDVMDTSFRTIDNKLLKRPSPELMDLLGDVSYKQEWLREYRIDLEEKALDYLGSFTDYESPLKFAQEIRKRFSFFTPQGMAKTPGHSPSKLLVSFLEEEGFTIMQASSLFNYPKRKLRLKEFRAFYLFDEYAPFIFVNTSDSKTGQIFSLVHEFVHSLISKDAGLLQDLSLEEERLCNKTTAELLMPEESLKNKFQRGYKSDSDLASLASFYSVSEQALAIKLKSLGLIGEEDYLRVLEKTKERIEKKKKSCGGPSYYRLKQSQLGLSFIDAVSQSTRSGNTLYKEAFKLLNVKGSRGYQGLTEASL